MKKIILFHFILCYQLAFAQNQWIQRADFGGGLRKGCCSFCIGSKAYLGVGYSDNYGAHRAFWEWDQGTNAWTQKAAFGGSARYFAAGFSIGTKGYIGTGYEGTSSCQDFWEWDQGSNTWSQKATFPGIARNHAVGFSIGSKGYIGTGTNDSLGLLKDFWEWDQAADSWTRKSDFGGSARQGAVAFVIGSKGYVGTGQDFSSPYPPYSHLTKDLWEWDQSTDSWSRKADFPGTCRYHATGFAIGARGFIGTGLDSTSTFKNDLWEWDLAGDSWTQRADLPASGRWLAAGFSLNGKGYIAAGELFYYSCYKDLWEYTPGNITHADQVRESRLFEIYPNPSSGNIKLAFPSFSSGTQLFIYSSEGKCVYESKLSPGPVQELDLPCKKGMYLVELRSGTERAFKKLILE